MDKLPTELDYASYRVVSKPSGITVNAPTGTSTKTINWKVDGTLNEGEVIEIELTTKVVRMPAADAKVKNVACLVISGTELCDEASTGAPGIEKTLIGDGIVTKVGDIVEWIITVKANGGSITNFNIVDKLPEELGYDSYVVVSKPSGITVNAPTGTSTKTINWKVDGTLNEGETIELKVTTKVVKMPADNQKVENVACLVVSGTEICDEEYIGKPFIEKTLIGSGVVSYTGEIVNWNIIAKPNGGFIEDFQFIENFKIVDGVPVQLEYVGYEVVHVPNGVVVSSPTT